MTEVDAQRVFDRFWRADPSRKRTIGGTGLGLAIALEDAQLHGGSLELWSEVGEGSCFRLTLPRVLGEEVTISPLPLPPEDAHVQQVDVTDSAQQVDRTADPEQVETHAARNGEGVEV